MLIAFTHPCGHTDEIYEEEWIRYEGDVPWDCPICAEARAEFRRHNAVYHAPLDAFIAALRKAPSGDSGEMDEGGYAWWEEGWRPVHALRAPTAEAIARGLQQRALELGPLGPDEYAPQGPPLDIAGLLRDLEQERACQDATLRWAENGVHPSEGAQVFWFACDHAHDKLDEELARRQAVLRG